MKVFVPSATCGTLITAGIAATIERVRAIVLALLTATGVLATILPARRACRVDPAVTLREE